MFRQGLKGFCVMVVVKWSDELLVFDFWAMSGIKVVLAITVYRSRVSW